MRGRSLTMQRGLGGRRSRLTPARSCTTAPAARNRHKSVAETEVPLLAPSPLPSSHPLHPLHFQTSLPLSPQSCLLLGAGQRWCSAGEAGNLPVTPVRAEHFGFPNPEISESKPRSNCRPFAQLCFFFFLKSKFSLSASMSVSFFVFLK